MYYVLSIWKGFLPSILLIQIIYAGDGESRKPKDGDRESRKPEVSIGDDESVFSSGHEFVKIFYHIPTTCDSCAKPLWGPFRPPPALECKRCRAKFHREHIADGAGVPPCKVLYDPTTAKDMLLLAPTYEDQQVWVARLVKKIQKDTRTT